MNKDSKELRRLRSVQASLILELFFARKRNLEELRQKREEIDQKARDPLPDRGDSLYAEWKVCRKQIAEELDECCKQVNQSYWSLRNEYQDVLPDIDVTQELLIFDKDN